MYSLSVSIESAWILVIGIDSLIEALFSAWLSLTEVPFIMCLINFLMPSTPNMTKMNVYRHFLDIQLI